jgi:glycerol-3-phosphate acyltransferase PlsY
MSAVSDSLPALGPLLLGIAGAYALGCANTGYYLVRWKTGQDLRATGSGNAGAKNVSRLLGPWGFGLTLLGDMCKGVVAVLAARLAGWPDAACGLVVIAVTAGHNWPAQLGFRGGKGVATGFGAVLAFDPVVAGLMLAACAAVLAATRRFTLSAVVAFALCPALAAYCHHTGAGVALLGLLAVIVVLPHVAHLRDESPAAPVQTPP